jgi:hypothetical protein
MNVPRRYVVSTMLFFLAACASTPEPRERLVDHVKPGWTIEQLVRTLGKPDQHAHGVADGHYLAVAVYHLADGMAIIRTLDGYVTEIKIRRDLPSHPVVASKQPVAAFSMNQQHVPPYTGLGVVQPAQSIDPSPPAIAPTPSTLEKVLVGLGQIAEAFMQAKIDANLRAPAQPPVILGNSSAIVLPSSGPLVPLSSGLVLPNESVIDSQIDGTFNGWTGDTIFALTNGQIWRQQTYEYFYHYAYMPRVLIVREGSGYSMHVVGANHSIAVRRIK